MAGRHIKVGVSGAPDPKADVSLSKVRVRERFMRWLFGPLQELTLIVPGRKIEDVTVTQHASASNDSQVKAEAETEELMQSMRRHPAGRKLRAVNGGDVA